MPAVTYLIASGLVSGGRCTAVHLVGEPVHVDVSCSLRVTMPKNVSVGSLYGGGKVATRVDFVCEKLLEPPCVTGCPSVMSEGWHTIVGDAGTLAVDSDATGEMNLRMMGCLF